MASEVPTPPVAQGLRKILNDGGILDIGI